MKINDNEVIVGSFWTTRERDYFYEVTNIVEEDSFPIKTKLCDFYGKTQKSEEYTFTPSGHYMSDQNSSFDIAERWHPERVLRLGEIWESTKGEEWKVVKVHMDFSVPIECVCLNVPKGTEPVNEVRFLHYGEWKYNHLRHCDDPGNLVKLLGMTVVKDSQYVEAGETKLVELTEDVYYEQIEDVMQVDTLSDEYLDNKVVTEEEWVVEDPKVEDTSTPIKEIKKSESKKLVARLFKSVLKGIGSENEPAEKTKLKLELLKDINKVKYKLEELEIRHGL